MTFHTLNNQKYIIPLLKLFHTIDQRAHEQMQVFMRILTLNKGVYRNKSRGGQNLNCKFKIFGFLDIRHKYKILKIGIDTVQSP